MKELKDNILFSENEIQIENHKSKANRKISNEYQTPNGYIPRRFIFIGLGTLAISICYITRVVLSVCIIKMQHKYDWSNSFKGYILASFSFGYCMTQIPAQKLCDKFGGKLVIFTGLTLSIFTLYLVPIASNNKATIILIRILCGIFQGVSFSTMNWLIGRWIPISERSSSACVIWSGVYSGTVIGDFITPVLLSFVSWENTFYIIGSGCLVWSLLWFIFMSDYPKDIHIVNIHRNEIGFINHGKELKNIELNSISNINNNHINNNNDNDNNNESINNNNNDISIYNSNQPKSSFIFILKTFLKSRSMLALMYLNISCNWAYFLLLSWAPTFLSKQIGNSDGFKFAFFNSLPYMVGFIISIIFGLVSDKLLAKGYKKINVRKSFGCFFYGLPAVFLFLLAFTKVDYIGKIAFLTIIIGSNGFTNVSAQIITLDISSIENASVAMGMANLCSGITATLGPIVGGYLLTAFNGDWKYIFLLGGCTYSIGLIVWIVFIKTDVVI